MAKKKAITPDSLIADVLGKNQKLKGHAYRQFIYGFPIPMAFSYLIGGYDKMPLGRWILLAGPPESMKTTLAAEMGRWCLLSDGIYIDVDVEQKKNPMLYPALYHNLDQLQNERWDIKPAGSVEAWQELAMGWIEKMSSEDVKQLAAGARVPLMMCIDTIIGKELEDDQDKLARDGHAAARGYATINNSIKKFLHGISLFGTTMTMVGITHQKEKIVEEKAGFKKGSFSKEMKNLGGDSAAFMASFTIESKRSGSHCYVDSEGRQVTGFLIQLTITKSSIGDRYTPSARTRRIYVPYVWRYEATDASEENPDEFQQISWWDWEWALGRLVYGCLHSDYYGNVGARQPFHDLFRPVDSKKGSDSVPKFARESKWSADHEPLFEDSEPRDMHEFGKAILANEYYREKTRALLRINKCSDLQELDALPIPHGV